MGVRHRRAGSHHERRDHHEDATPDHPRWRRHRPSRRTTANTAGGFLVAAAITKYVFIAVNRNFDGDLLLKYSQIERVSDPSDAQHRLLREILLVTEVEAGVEISSMADIPAGTGLGSSGAFTVGALQALRAHRREHPSNVELAKLACHVELDRLGEPIGKQDQYIAAVGGVTAFSFEANDDVEVQPLDLSPETRERLEDNLMLFYTGIRRSASEVLAIETDGVGQSTGRPDREPRRGQGTGTRHRPGPRTW